MNLKNSVKIILLLSLLVSKLNAQNGNEWINPAAEYLKISVVKEGFCRILPGDLSAASFDLNTIDPRSFRLLRRGKEWSFRVIGEQDGVFGTGDYLEFYGYANNGELEKELYLDGTQMHPYYSLYTDTAAYFLTWGGVSGKRIETINPSAQSTESDFVRTENLFLETGSFLTGIDRAPETFYTEGDLGEGFSSSGIRNNNNKDFTYNLTTQASNVGSVELEIQLVGAYANSRVVTFTISSGTNTITQVSSSFSNFETYKEKIILPENFLGTSLKINVASVSSDNKSDFISLNYVRLKYPIGKNLSSLSTNLFFETPAQTRTSLQLNNSNNTFYVLEDSASWKEIASASNAFTLHNDKGYAQKYFLRNGAVFNAPAKIERAEFVDFSTPLEYLIVTHKNLMVGTQVFLDFKLSPEGGSRKAAVFEIGKLYNTFSYGDYNPIAIKHLVKSQYDLGEADALMIIGNGLAPGNSQGGKFYRKVNYDPNVFSNFEFVPTFGQPGSDICFSQNIIPQTPYLPALATGRLTAANNEMILDYVSKLKEHALVTPEDKWVKNLLHLSGGKTSNEAAYFFNIIDGWKTQADGQFLGGNVTLLSKQTSQPVELYNISEQVNEGLSMISYVGHSSPNTIEIDIGDASDPTNGYRNKGKYPVLFINGCNSLDVFNSYTRAENWVNAKDRGAIAAFGHTRYGYTSPFQRYTRDFYAVAFQDSLFYGKSIGEIQKETIKRYGKIAPNNYINYTHMEQFALLGDPDIQLKVPEKADFFIKDNLVQIVPFRQNEPISSSVDSIRIQFTVGNWGRVKKDSIEICISRFYKDLKESIVYGPFTIATPGFEEELSFDLFNKLEKSNGENLFQIYLDCKEDYEEYDEQNNFLNFTYDMPSNGIKLLFPYPFAIVGEPSIDFSVQSQDQKTVNETYLLDISDKFDFSSVLIHEEKIADNVAIFKNVVFTPTTDTATYYWRARLKNVPEGEDTVWEESSFTIIPTKTGWGQFEYGQFRKDNFERIVDDGSKLVYDSAFTNIQFETVGADFEEDFVYNTSIIVNDRTITESLWHVGCNIPGFLLLPFDGGTLLTYKGKSASPYSACGLDPKTTAHFSPANAGGRNRMKSYLDSIPVGDYVILLSTSNNLIENLNIELKESLHQFGCYSLDTLKNGTPYVFIGRKGNNIPLYEKIELDKSVKISDSYSIRDLSNSGKIVVDGIGQSQGFKEWSWSFDGDTTEKFAIDLKDENSTLFNKNEYQGKEYLDSVFVDFLNQSAVITDKVARTLSEIGHWALSYDIVPEGAVVPSVNKDFNKVNAQIYQGDTIKQKVSFVNVSTAAFDSVWVFWSLKQLSSGEQMQDSTLLDVLLSTDTLDFYVNIFEPKFLGEVEFSLTFNPQKQSEQDYTNNTFYQKIKIVPDLIAPITELRLNGELPQSFMQSTNNPLIEIFISDNNQKVVKRDTLGIEMFLSGPCEENQSCDLNRVYFSDSVTAWQVIADKMYIQLAYENLAAGQYEFKVFSSDAFGNVSQIPATLSFVVESQTELSYFLPYPSPFSSEMHFVYQMKGYKQPKNLKVQILNSAGILVYELDEQKIGRLKPGSNQTEWFWDGTDFKGNVLPNGVYMYRVQVDDPEIKHYKTDADIKFKDSWGTILIAR